MRTLVSAVACRLHGRSFAWLLLASMLVATRCCAESSRPNIVFIFSDDHAVQAIGAYGSTHQSNAPHRSACHARVPCSSNSFCANSLCGPSRACILTGKHSHVNGFLSQRGSIRRPPDDISAVTASRRVSDGSHWQVASRNGSGRIRPLGDPAGTGKLLQSRFHPEDGGRRRYEGYCTDIITDLSLRWLKEQRDPSRPFMLMCQHKAPHRNWAPAARHFQLFQDTPCQNPTHCATTTRVDLSCSQKMK